MNEILERREQLNHNGVAQKVKISVAEGDGIGPEIMNATLEILTAAQVPLDPDFIRVGEEVYLSGNSSGISRNAWDSIRNTRILLKAPINTPQGKGYKSLNVTLRKSLGLFANVRPVESLHPYVDTNFPEMNVVVIRENEEDLYAGIEHRQTEDVHQCLKLITRPGCERIVRYAFEYARVHNRKKVTCMVKHNIMKMTDGLFNSVFEEIGKEYPDIIQDTQIIDIASARLATRPGDYDVIVTPNLYGDIISDIAAELTGSVGLAGSANIGREVAMFEAIHGTAPDIAGLNFANPSGLLNGAVMMLDHLGFTDHATMVKNAWLKTIEDGIHTRDIYHPGQSKMKVTTADFARAVIDRMGEQPTKLSPVTESTSGHGIVIPEYKRPYSRKILVGCDVFLDSPDDKPELLGKSLDQLRSSGLKLKMITNRGVKVYPGGIPETFCTDHWRCRFVAENASIESGKIDYKPIKKESLLALLTELTNAGYDVIKTENLYEFDGKRGFSLGQGE